MSFAFHFSLFGRTALRHNSPWQQNSQNCSTNRSPPSTTAGATGAAIAAEEGVSGGAGEEGDGVTGMVEAGEVGAEEEGGEDGVGALEKSIECTVVLYLILPSL